MASNPTACQKGWPVTGSAGSMIYPYPGLIKPSVSYMIYLAVEKSDKGFPIAAQLQIAVRRSLHSQYAFRPPLNKLIRRHDTSMRIRFLYIGNHQLQKGFPISLMCSAKPYIPQFCPHIHKRSSHFYDTRIAGARSAEQSVGIMGSKYLLTPTSFL